MRPRIAALIIATLVPVPTVAATAPAQISVGGHATVRAEPDRAVLRLGVETQQESAGAAQRETDRIARAIHTSLETLGVPGAAIQTSSLNLHPVYSQRRPTDRAHTPTVVGYRADNTVQVTLTDLDRVGPAIDGAIGAGANRVLGLTFSLEDDSEMQLAALKAAVSQAAAKAAAIADTLGQALGAVVEVREGGVSVRPVAAMRMQAEMAMDGGAPVAPGEVSVSASVTIVYALAD